MRWITIKYKIIHQLPGFTNYRFNDSTLIMIHRKYIQYMYGSMIFQKKRGLLQNTGEGATRLFSNWLGKRGDFFCDPLDRCFPGTNGLDIGENKIQITINTKFRIVSTVFSFDAGNRHISLAIAMNFPSMAFMLKTKLSCLYYFNSVSLSFAGMYKCTLGVNRGLYNSVIENKSVCTWLQFDLNFVYEKALL